MAFDISLYKCSAEKNRMDKSFFLEDEIVLNGTLKENTSIIDPIIVIQQSILTVALYNYMYINNFGRYYFITDIVSISNTLTEVHCHCDVLMSFREQILTNDGIVSRSENNWNLYLNDGSFKVYANSIVLTKAFPSGFTDQSYIIAVASP